MHARSTSRRGAVALRASLSSLERTGGATWILEAVGRPICPLRFAADHDIQTRYELPGGSTSAWHDESPDGQVRPGLEVPHYRGWAWTSRFVTSTCTGSRFWFS